MPCKSAQSLAYQAAYKQTSYDKDHLWLCEWLLSLRGKSLSIFSVLRQLNTAHGQK